jgi:two-component system copper resistance phosphate regulon response regulator CusR
MKILVIEDEVKTAAFLQQGLRESGFNVDLARNGEDGLHLAQGNNYDLLVLDVMLPGRDGWSVIRELRQSGNQTLAIFLTAKDATSDRVKGLELGGDAYLVKPFVFSELIAHVRSLLRRGPSRQLEIIRVGELEIDFVQHRVHRNGTRIDLRPKEFQLLTLLARRKGEVLSRTIIAEQVWDMNFDSDTNVVDVQIRRLRTKIDVPGTRKLIHTVRGMGYVLRESEEGE